jgi:hypothetical protein
MIHEIISATSPMGHKTYFVRLIPLESDDTADVTVRMCSDPEKAEKFLPTEGAIYGALAAVKKCYPDAKIEDHPRELAEFKASMSNAAGQGREAYPTPACSPIQSGGEK